MEKQNDKALAAAERKAAARAREETLRPLLEDKRKLKALLKRVKGDSKPLKPEMMSELLQRIADNQASINDIDPFRSFRQTAKAIGGIASVVAFAMIANGVTQFMSRPSPGSAGAILTPTPNTVASAVDATVAPAAVQTAASDKHLEETIHAIVQEEKARSAAAMPAMEEIKPEAGGRLQFKADGSVDQSLPISIMSNTFVCPSLALAEAHVAQSYNFAVANAPCELTPPSLVNDEGFAVRILKTVAKETDDFFQIEGDFYGVTRRLWAPSVSLRYDMSRYAGRREMAKKLSAWRGSGVVYLDGAGNIDAGAPLKLSQWAMACGDYQIAKAVLIDGQGSDAECVQAAESYPARLIDGSKVKYNRLVQVSVQTPMMTVPMWAKLDSLSYR